MLGLWGFMNVTERSRYGADVAAGLEVRDPFARAEGKKAERGRGLGDVRQGNPTRVFDGPPITGVLYDLPVPALRRVRVVSDEAPALPVRQRSKTARTRSSWSATSVYSSLPVWCSTL